MPARVSCRPSQVAHPAGHLASEIGSGSADCQRELTQQRFFPRWREEGLVHEREGAAAFSLDWKLVQSTETSRRPDLSEPYGPLTCMVSQLSDNCLRIRRFEGENSQTKPFCSHSKWSSLVKLFRGQWNRLSGLQVPWLGSHRSPVPRLRLLPRGKGSWSREQMLSHLIASGQVSTSTACDPLASDDPPRPRGGCWGMALGLKSASGLGWGWGEGAGTGWANLTTIPLTGQGAWRLVGWGEAHLGLLCSLFC